MFQLIFSFCCCVYLPCSNVNRKLTSYLIVFEFIDDARRWQQIILVILVILNCVARISMNDAKGGQHQPQHNLVSFIHVWLCTMFLSTKTFLNCENSHKKANTIVTALILFSYNSYFNFFQIFYNLSLHKTKHQNE